MVGMREAASREKPQAREKQRSTLVDRFFLPSPEGEALTFNDARITFRASLI